MLGQAQRFAAGYDIPNNIPYATFYSTDGKTKQINIRDDGIWCYTFDGGNSKKVWEAALKSDLGSYFKNNDLSSYTEDCNACTRIISFINASTLNTPYKQIGTGQNISSEGLLISIKPFVSGVYNCQYVFAVGEIQGKRIYSRYKRSDSAWTTWSGIV